MQTVAQTMQSLSIGAPVTAGNLTMFPLLKTGTGAAGYRLLGLVFRKEGVTPDRLEDLIRVLRQVYAGLYPAHAMSVEQAIDLFCPEQRADLTSASSGDEPSGCTVH